MTRKILVITLGFSLLAGGFWAGRAQDPQKPSDVRKDLPTVSAQQTTQTDLSGTYAGTFNCDALGLTGDTTMTINGNEFTLADGRTGRIVASTTGGYTAVALQLTPAATATGAPAATTTPQVVSMRARKSGKRLTLTSVGGTTMKCSFMPSRNMARNRRNQTTPAATGTEVSNPATPATPATTPSAVPTESPKPSPETPMPKPTPETPMPKPSPETPMPSQTPSPSPTPTASPTPEPTPVPNPSPEPQPTTTPTPVPTPGEPTPSPTASPSPTPSPTPTPTPKPKN